MYYIRSKRCSTAARTLRIARYFHFVHGPFNGRVVRLVEPIKRSNNAGIHRRTRGQPVGDDDPIDVAGGATAVSGIMHGDVKLVGRRNRATSWAPSLQLTPAYVLIAAVKQLS